MGNNPSAEQKPQVSIYITDKPFLLMAVALRYVREYNNDMNWA